MSLAETRPDALAAPASAPPARLAYRAEIDGLRAVAVLPVILFHAGIEAFSGGFVGVDVFFVISGYLIAALLLAELEGGRIDLARFWIRRARRILPALYLVTAVSAALGWAWMLPDPLENLGQSIVATVLFSNNMLLWATAGYWDLSSEFKPLLHTWSLAVEEQYYLVFPLALLALHRLGPRALALALGAAALASLVAAELTLPHAPSGAFYLLATRAWEMLLGALAALALARGAAPTLGRATTEAAGLAGLALIAASVLLFDATTPVPGLPALAPTTGALLIVLFAHRGTLAARLLAAPPLVGIGLISYSAYLWHQPVFAFARIHARETPSEAAFLALAAATLLLAALSWRFVERPFRDPARLSDRTALAAALAASVALAVTGWAMHASHGAPGRLDLAEDARGGRHIAYNERIFALSADAFARPEAANLLVLGHSFARDAANMLRETHGDDRLEIVYRDDLGDCLPAASPALDRLLADADAVIFAVGHRSDPACAGADLARVAAAGAEAFWIGPKHFGHNLNWLARLPAAARAAATNPAPTALAARDARLAATLPAGRYFSLAAALRSGDGVRVADDAGRLLSADRIHLTEAGARFLGRRVLADGPIARLVAAPPARRPVLAAPPAR